MNVFHDRRPDTYHNLASEEIYTTYGIQSDSRGRKTAPETKHPRRRGAGR
jgi:hypothetical protein